MSPHDDPQPTEVGQWAEEKHARIRAYLKLAAKPALKNFLAPGKAGFYYVDPFCGPPRARIRGTDQEIDGSAIVAAQAARVTGLLTDDELHSRLSAAARRTATERFCTDRIIPMYERYYEEVCS